MSVLHNNASSPAADAAPVTQLPTPSTADKVMSDVGTIADAAHKGLSYAIARRERASQALND